MFDCFYIKPGMFIVYSHSEVINKMFDNRSLCTHLNLLHMVVRSGCGVALVGHMSGRDTAQ